MYSPDGRRIVSGSEDGTVRVWDTESAAEAAVLRGDEGSITSVAYSPDGRRIAVANSWSLRHYTARVFGVESGTEVAVLRADGDAVRSIEFSPDGRRIFGGSDDGRVHVWDAQTYKRLEVVQGGGDVKPIATGVSIKPPLRAIARVHETVIERTEDGKPVAWFPIVLGQSSPIPPAAPGLARSPTISISSASRGLRNLRAKRAIKSPKSLVVPCISAGEQRDLRPACGRSPALPRRANSDDRRRAGLGTSR